jgi:hypothetical protein
MRLSIVIPLMFTLLGCIIFMAGYHAVDTAWNMQRIGSNSDINYFGRVATSDSLYMQGLNMLLMGFGIVGFSLLFVGVKKDV